MERLRWRWERFFVYIIVLVWIAYGQKHCPCDDPVSMTHTSIEDHNYPPQRNLSSPHPLALCIGAYQLALHHERIFSKLVVGQALHSTDDFEIKLWTQSMSLASIPDECNVFVNLIEYNVTTTKEGVRSQVCPGQCKPVPTRDLIVQLLFWQSINRHYHPQSHGLSSNHSISHRNDDLAHIPVTCTLTREMLNDAASMHKQSTLLALRFRLKYIAWRIIMECFEKKHWIKKYASAFNYPLFNAIETIPRRTVRSIVAWVGNAERLDLIRDQSVTLRGYPFHGPNAVIGWAATDETFNCSLAALECRMQSRRGRQFIPRSTINQYAVGWRCAQRRPLRALAHILTLLDPQQIVIGDDDTFVNYPLLERRYAALLDGDMLDNAIVLGELTGAEGDTGHYTKKGFYAGGSGYILGRRLLEDLVSKKVRYWHQADSPMNSATDLVPGDIYRSSQQIMQLSMVREGLMKQAFCPSTIGNSSCVILPSNSSTEYASIATRLIDYCVNILANDNTCLHSDHSMTQCFVYGAGAQSMGSVCHSQVAIAVTPRFMWPGMCFMAPACLVDRHVTCHRYKPIETDHTFKAARISTSKGYYRVYSSMFDGNKSDTYLR